MLRGRGFLSSLRPDSARPRRGLPEEAARCWSRRAGASRAWVRAARAGAGSRIGITSQHLNRCSDVVCVHRPYTLGSAPALVPHASACPGSSCPPNRPCASAGTGHRLETHGSRRCSSPADPSDPQLYRGLTSPCTTPPLYRARRAAPCIGRSLCHAQGDHPFAHQVFRRQGAVWKIQLPPSSPADPLLMPLREHPSRLVQGVRARTAGVLLLRRRRQAAGPVLLL